MRLIVPLTVTLLVLPLLAAAQEGSFPGVEKLMSPEEYEAAGLDKLTPAEREALNRWLISYTAFEAPVMRRSNEEVKEVEEAFEIRARIVSPFKGWSGKTVFRLDNGQVWRQRLEGRFAYGGDDTEVVIRKNFFGYYRMTHRATGAAVGVTRLE